MKRLHLIGYLLNFNQQLPNIGETCPYKGNGGSLYAALAIALQLTIEGALHSKDAAISIKLSVICPLYYAVSGTKHPPLIKRKKIVLSL